MQYKTELERILTSELRKHQPQICAVSIVGDGEFAVYNVADRYSVRRLSGAGKEFLRSGQMMAGSPVDCLMSESPDYLRCSPTDSPRLSFLKHYQCRDCGAEVGMRSRRREWTERYIFPLLFLKPVRCACCFRRDYWLISTSVCERADATIELNRRMWRIAPRT